MRSRARVGFVGGLAKSGRGHPLRDTATYEYEKYNREGCVAESGSCDSEPSGCVTAAGGCSVVEAVCHLERLHCLRVDLC